MQLDIRIMELLISKVCHDLISPVGAINNGVELIEDIGGDMIDEAIKLINASGQQAAKRLRMFRIAYGRTGSEAGLAVKDARIAGVEYLSQSKIKINWEPTETLKAIAGKSGGLKLLLCAIMLAEEALSHGGNITVASYTPEPGEDELKAVQLSVTGSHALLHDNIIQALSGSSPIEEITPRTVHAYVLGRMSEYYGFKVSWKQIADTDLSLMLICEKDEESVFIG
jgi:histidine phosphotransferase ChpT